MDMELRKAQRQKAKIKMGLQGPSGSGKTMSALLIAFGLTGNWSKIAVIDTEFHSADLYAHLGSYNVLSLETPFTPENYITAIHTCENEGMEVIIIDSISHEWESVLDIHANLAGNSYTNWSKLTPRHNAFVNAILQSKAHIIATIRAKQDYVLVEKNGKMVPEKVGLKGITREGMDYELTLLFELDIKHNTNVSKDRTGLFTGRPEFKVTSNIGTLLLQWCNTGVTKEELSSRINNCIDTDELYKLYNDHTEFQQELKEEFISKKQSLENSRLNLKFSSNGIIRTINNTL